MEDVHTEQEHEDGLTLVDLAILLSENKKMLLVFPLIAGLLAFAMTFAIRPIYTAKTVFIPPQQQQNSTAVAAMQSLGALAGLTGTSVKNPVDQYVSFMQSATIANRLVDRFKLTQAYNLTSLEEARRRLSKNVRIEANKKDGLVSVEVDDEDPTKAAALANNYVDQLRQLTSEFVLTEAQQRRALFERLLQQTKERLIVAQKALQGSGFNEGALKAEPKAAAESYANLKAQATAAEIRLRAMSGYLTADASEFKLAQANLSAMRAQLASAEGATLDASSSDYIGKYREYKYQEMLFSLFANQYEMAKLDETKDGAFIQVVDAAYVPEQKTRPRCIFVALSTVIGVFAALLLFAVIRESWRAKLQDPAMAAKFARLKASLR